VACGDNSAANFDAATPRNHTLSVLNPPGDAIGLDFSGSITLRVQLVDADGLAISGAPIDFTLLQTGAESTSGASLSGATRRSNGIGIAEVDLVVGAERASFRVEASTPNAPSVLFYIQVSDQGFSDASIVSAHQGPRDPSSYDQVELRIYDDRDASCNAIDFQSPPESLFPTRTQQALGEQSEFRNLAVGLGYTVIAWAEAGTPATPQATGCLHIAADRLRSGTAFSAVLPVSDSPYQLSLPLQLQTNVDLQLLADTLSGTEAWSTLACPLGRAQLLLDCLPDAQSPDTLLDCSAEGSGPLLDALELRRGTTGADGCRPATLASGEPSLDALLDTAMQGWPSASEVASLTNGREFVLGTIRIDSELSVVGPTLARHRLIGAQIDSFHLDFATTALPIIEVSAIPLALDASPTLTVPAHEFTLNYQQIALAAYEALALEPANVATLGQTLGEEFMGGVDISGQLGCAALESFVCTQLSLGATCADQCSTIAPELSTLLGAWSNELQSTGLDYQFAMQAVAVDGNSDLEIDEVAAASDSVDVQLTTDLQSILLPASVTSTQP